MSEQKRKKEKKKVNTTNETTTRPKFVFLANRRGGGAMLVLPVSFPQADLTAAGTEWSKLAGSSQCVYWKIRWGLAKVRVSGNLK